MSARRLEARETMMTATDHVGHMSVHDGQIHWRPQTMAATVNDSDGHNVDVTYTNLWLSWIWPSWSTLWPSLMWPSQFVAVMDWPLWSTLWPSWTCFVAVVVCGRHWRGRHRLWPSWNRPWRHSTDFLQWKRPFIRKKCRRTKNRTLEHTQVNMSSIYKDTLEL